MPRDPEQVAVFLNLFSHLENEDFNIVTYQKYVFGHSNDQICNFFYVSGLHSPGFWLTAPKTLGIFQGAESFKGVLLC